MATPQQVIGHYRIVSKLGEGGMGEVWRATDTRLNREVAIKVLPLAFANDPMRMGRFAHEAQVLASLNHPGIAAIYGVEEGALVMELAEGPTLAERIARGKVPLDEALPIATQIAEALEYAHEKGVIHRDLKPANIKVTPEGRVKILDFGLAKAMSAESSAAESAEAATLSSPATMAGTILGTAAYMSPEQARGQNVDRRADIWAFGVVLYEMLAGERPFGGATISDTLAAVLRAEPDLSAFSEPAHAFVARCLEKDPRQRWRCIGDAAYALQQPVASVSAAAAPNHRPSWLPTCLVVTAVVAAALLTWRLKPQPPPDSLVGRFSYSLPSGQTFWRAGRHVLTISPDGSKIVYTSGQHLYLRPLNALDAQVIPGTAPDLYEPVFSPDGQWIAYFVPGSPDVLQKIPVSGGAPVTLCSLKGTVAGASWSDGRIVFGDGGAGGIFGAAGTGSTIEAVSDAGGMPQVLATFGPGDVAAQPQLLDHGHRLLFMIISGGSSGDAGHIVIQDLDAPASRRAVLTSGADPHLLPDGRLVYIHDGTLFGARLNASRHAVTGTPVPLVVGVNESATTYVGQYAVSSNGTLVYWPGSYGGLTQPTQMAWLDQQGRETSLTAPLHNYDYPRISPDGKLIAVNTLDKPADLWIWDTVRYTLSRLTFGVPLLASNPQIVSAWTRDGLNVYYTAIGGKLYRKSANGTGQAKTVSGSTSPLQAISPDGKYAILVSYPGEGNLMLQPLQPPGAVKPLLPNSEFDVRNADISPDGHWIVYQSNETGQNEIYVRPFPNVDAGRWQISNGGGRWPVWSRDGNTLDYVSGLGTAHQMMAVAVQLHPTFSAGQPQPLFPFPSTYLTGVSRRFDVAPDGRFLIVKADATADTAQAQSFTIVTHWTSEVAARVH